MADKRSIEFDNAFRKVLNEGSADFLKDTLAMVACRIMELEATKLAGAEKGERSAERQDHRNGYRPRTWDTRVGTIDLQVPKLRRTGYVPTFLEPRQRGEKALLAVIQEAYVLGVSTRKVDDLLQAMGLTGISKSEVSRVCEELDEHVREFRSRPLEGRFPYLWLDARYEKVRIGQRVVSNAVVVAYAVRETGEREIIGIDVGPSEDDAFWNQFLRALVERGLAGVQLVISDAHKGLKKAIREILSGATWQRCRVHFMRNILATVPKSAQPLLSALVKSVFGQPDQKSAREQARKIVDVLRKKRLDRAADLLEEAVEDVIAFMGFPTAHWRQLHSTNPLERLNRELARRTRVVGIFPNPASVLRLVTMLVIEQNDEWSEGRRYFSQESMAALYATAASQSPLALEALGEAA